MQAGRNPRTRRGSWLAGLSWAALGLAAAAPLAQDPPKLDGPLTEKEQRDDPVPEAERLIEERETAGSLDRAIRLLEWHLERRPELPRLHELLAEAHSRTCEGLPPAKPENRAAHELHRTRGRQQAEEAIRLAPDSGPAHYWLAALLLHAADAERSLGLAKKALVELDRADQIMPTIDQGGPARMRGKVLEDLPGLFGGSTSKAIASYQRSLEVAPDCILTHLWLAEAYDDDGKHDLQRKELNWVIAAKPRPKHEKEDGEDQAKAREELRKLDGN